MLCQSWSCFFVFWKQTNIRPVRRIFRCWIYFTKAQKWLRYSEIKYLWSRISESCAGLYGIHNQRVSSFRTFKALFLTSKTPFLGSSKHPYDAAKAMLWPAKRAAFALSKHSFCNFMVHLSSFQSFLTPVSKLDGSIWKVAFEWIKIDKSAAS